MADQDSSGRLVALPDLDGDIFEFTWDLVFDGPDDWPHAVVRLCDKEILRERTWYENVDHLRTIILSLLSKYPGRVYDVIPTEYSEALLYGDDMGASKKIARARALCRKDLERHRIGG